MLDFVRKLRKNGVLLDTKGHLLDPGPGVILFTCSDGHRFGDIFRHQAEMLPIEGGHKQCDCNSQLIHTLACNGGALRLAPDSITNTGCSQYDDYQVAEIQDARTMKSIETVALYIHLPCGKAAACGLTPYQVFDHLILAKRRLKVLGFHVACFCHVDYSDKKRTYFVSREAWDTFAQTTE